MPNPKSWDDRNDSYYLELYAEKAKVEEIYALCLTGASETYHHWKVFSSGSSGVCIDFNKEKFVEACKNVPGLRAETVDYRKIDDLGKNPPKREELPFLKRIPFQDEDEFRLFIAPKSCDGGGFRVHIPLDAINYIHLSPWLPDSVANQVKVLLRSIEGCADIRMHKSTLIENQKWKRHGAAGT